MQPPQYSLLNTRHRVFTLELMPVLMIPSYVLPLPAQLCQNNGNSAFKQAHTLHRPTLIMLLKSTVLVISQYVPTSPPPFTSTVLLSTPKVFFYQVTCKVVLHGKLLAIRIAHLFWPHLTQNKTPLHLLVDAFAAVQALRRNSQPSIPVLFTHGLLSCLILTG